MKRHAPAWTYASASCTMTLGRLCLQVVPLMQGACFLDRYRSSETAEKPGYGSKKLPLTHPSKLNLLANLCVRSGEFIVFPTHRDELQRTLDQAGQQHEALSAVVRDQAHQLERSRDELADQARQHQHDLEQLRADLVGQLHTAQATLQQAQQELERRLIEQANQVDQVRRDLKEQQEALVTLRRDMTTLVEQQVREVLTALEQVERDQVQDAAQLHGLIHTLMTPGAR